MTTTPDPVQWDPSGNPFDGIPAQITRLLADDDGKTFGYGYGPGVSMIFGTVHGDIAVLPTQWVQRHDDGRVTVHDVNPDGCLGTERR